MPSVCIRAGVLFLVIASLSSREVSPRPASSPLPAVRQLERSPVTVADLQRRGTITFLMHHGAASYFLYRGEQIGFEYELARGFAKELGVELEVVTPPPDVELTSWLKAGKGDVLAGLFTNSEENKKTLRVSLPYLETRTQILSGSAASGIDDVTQLAGKTIAVQPDALSYAHQLLSSLPPWSLLPVLTKVPSDDGVNSAVQAVERGQATAMLVPELVAEITQRVYPGKLRTIWTIPEPVQLVWAVRPEQTDLLHAINDYLERANRSGLRKILFDKYFVTAEYLGNSTRMAESTLIAKRLSRYDHLIARHAEEAGFDWRLVAALIFEE